MKKLNLTNPNDILGFGFNYDRYKSNIPLPLNITFEIEKYIHYSNTGFITNNEMGNQILDYMYKLDVKIAQD